MKRILDIFIALVLAFGATACGNSDAKAHEREQTSASAESTSTSENEEKNSVKSNIEFDFETKTVTLNSGYEMPIYGLGIYSLEGYACVQSVTAALENGVRLIDTAYMYRNEESVGIAVRNSSIPREEIFVITKLYPNQFSDPEAAIGQALEKLDIDYIDIMLLHHPGTDDIKAYKAMEQAVKDGKIHSIGLSNWYVEELEDFLPRVDTVPALVQNEIHPTIRKTMLSPTFTTVGSLFRAGIP